MDTADYTIVNKNDATELPTNCRSTSPDISMASNVIALLPEWSVHTSLASDHLPILITINSELSAIYRPRRAYINYKKADWVRYAEACDEYLAEAGETRTVEQAEKTSRKTVSMACGIFTTPVAFDTSKQACRYQPISDDERDQKNQLNSADEMLNDLNKHIKKTGGVIQANQMAIRRRQMRPSSRHVASMAAFYGPTRKNPHNWLSKTYLDRKKIANKFVHQYTPPPIRLEGDEFKSQLKRKFHQLPLIGTPADKNQAIRLAKSSTDIGPNGMSTLHRNYLAHVEICYLINVFKLSISTGQDN